MAEENDGRAIVLLARWQSHVHNLTVWDTYALAALTGIAAKPDGRTALQVATRVIEFADAMIIERAKHFGEGVT